MKLVRNWKTLFCFTLTHFITAAFLFDCFLQTFCLFVIYKAPFYLLNGYVNVLYFAIVFCFAGDHIWPNILCMSCNLEPASDCCKLLSPTFHYDFMWLWICKFTAALYRNNATVFCFFFHLNFWFSETACAIQQLSAPPLCFNIIKYYVIIKSSHVRWQ